MFGIMAGTVKFLKYLPVGIGVALSMSFVMYISEDLVSFIFEDVLLNISSTLSVQNCLNFCVIGP